MKNIGTDLKNHLASEVTTLATCWKITRRDAVVLGFTDHDSDLVVDGVTHKAQTGFTPSAVQSTSGLAVDNLEAEGVLDSEAISEEDIRAGLYDFAEIDFFLVNYANLAQGKLPLRTGWIGEVTLADGKFVAEVRGLTQKLNQKIGEVYSPLCRAQFCDTKCKLNVASFTFSTSVSAVASLMEFKQTAVSKPTGYFNYGRVKFTSGANSGLEMEVKEYNADGTIKLVLPMPYSIAMGDNFQAIAGCDKSFKSCTEKFSNAVNFRGEPHVPGSDSAFQTAGTIKR